ncbi:MAG: hypothetical protein KGH64_03100 [Candidatus Micrarchaeota archaeon]|nr:hypothetical protein [Candidatus Micrarchaeota archaeon]MDE1834300.1 hypothetical protein [Candidatus Micrarchaeota archaeon]MDE1859439.1 hypothetical protein [Candidatus Micrarchaeota archaeon]
MAAPVAQRTADHKQAGNGNGIRSVMRDPRLADGAIGELITQARDFQNIIKQMVHNKDNIEVRDDIARTANAEILNIHILAESCLGVVPAEDRQKVADMLKAMNKDFEDGIRAAGYSGPAYANMEHLKPLLRGPISDAFKESLMGGEYHADFDRDYRHVAELVNRVLGEHLEIVNAAFGELGIDTDELKARLTKVILAMRGTHPSPALAPIGTGDVSTPDQVIQADLGGKGHDIYEAPTLEHDVVDPQATAAHKGHSQ